MTSAAQNTKRVMRLPAPRGFRYLLPRLPSVEPRWVLNCTMLRMRLRPPGRARRIASTVGDNREMQFALKLDF